MPASLSGKYSSGSNSVESGGGQHEALLCRRTGKIYWRSEVSDLEGFENRAAR